MGQQHRTVQPATHRAPALWLVVPVVAGVAGALGWSHVLRLQAPGTGNDPQLALAALTSALCLAVAGWWLGGLAMVGVGALARALRWHPLERWATRLTPGLVARTAAALVGAQLIALSPAHADDAAPDPFWAPAAPGTEQLAPPTEGGSGTAPGRSPGTPAGTPGAPGAPGSEDPALGTADGGHTDGPGDTPDGGQRNPQFGTPAREVSTGGTGEQAASSPDRPVDPADAHAPDGVHGTVDRAAETPAAGAEAPAHREAPAARDRVADGALTVVEGDTLWDLTAQLLGPGAADGAVCGHLASWLDHNTLAEHGDLIHPGDVLRVPPRLLDAAGSSR